MDRHERCFTPGWSHSSSLSFITISRCQRWQKICGRDPYSITAYKQVRNLCLLEFFIPQCELRFWVTSYSRCSAGWMERKCCWMWDQEKKWYGGNGRTIRVQLPYLHRLMGLLILFLWLMPLPPVFCSPNKQLLQESTQQCLWNPLQKMDQLPLLLQLLSYLKVLEGLIQKFSQIFWGISSMFSESVVATAHVLSTPSLAELKTVRFHDACSPDQALSQARGSPQISKNLPLPLWHQAWWVWQESKKWKWSQALHQNKYLIVSKVDPVE